MDELFCYAVMSMNWWNICEWEDLRRFATLHSYESYVRIVEVEENSCNYVIQSSKLMLIFVSNIEVHSKKYLGSQVHVKLR